MNKKTKFLSLTVAKRYRSIVVCLKGAFARPQNVDVDAGGT